MKKCPCGSGLEYSECCEPLIKGTAFASTAEQLMRARYSAYAEKEVDFLGASLHANHSKDFDPKSTRTWAENSEWHGLRIVSTKDGGPDDEEGQVEFIASYSQKGKMINHHELASFRKDGGRWFFVDGEGVTPKPVVREAQKVGRNDPCPCGSGRKFKKCCGV